MERFKFDTRQELILCKAKLAKRDQSTFIKLAVDTGASITIISIGAALAVDIDPSKSRSHIEITTANGVVLAPIIKLPSFKCFGIEAKNMKVVCHDLPPQSPVEGLLGLNFLKKAKVTIDFSKNTINLP